MPHPITSLIGKGDPGDVRYTVVPNLARPSYLLPANVWHRYQSVRGLIVGLGLSALAPRAKAMVPRRGSAVSIDRQVYEEIRETLRQVSMTEAPILAFRFGRGAYQTTTAALLHEDGRPATFAKMSMDSLGRESIEQEEGILRSLALVPTVAKRVPRVFDRGTIAGHDTLSVSPGPARGGWLELGDVHRDFLRSLPRQPDSHYLESPGWHRIMELASSLPESRIPSFRRLSERIAREFGAIKVPNYLSHRDFTTWNTRRNDNEIFVFDWETANYAGPGHDVFHFAAARRAFSGRRPQQSLKRFIPWEDAGQWMHHLYLTYLADTATRLASARRLSGQTAYGPLWEWIWPEIDRAMEGRAEGPA